MGRPGLSRPSRPNRATVDVVLVRGRDGTPDLLPDDSGSCRSCGMCGVVTRQSATHSDGTPVQLSLPVHSLITLAAGVYGLPLVGLLAGALTATALGAGDAVTLAGAVAGGATAIVGMRRGARMLEESALAQMKFHTSHGEFSENADAL